MTGPTYDSPPPYTAVPSSSSQFTSNSTYSQSLYQRSLPPLPNRPSTKLNSGRSTLYSDKRVSASGGALGVENIAGNAVETAVGVTSASFGDAGVNATHSIDSYAMIPPQHSGVYLEESLKSMPQNKVKLYIKQSNNPLELNESWSGRKCHLFNRNGSIAVHGSMVANGSIHLETSKGNITVDGHMVAAKDIYVKSSHGLFSVLGSSIIAETLTIINSHHPLHLDKQIEAKKLVITNKNSPIVMSRISIVSLLSIRATKASVDICIREIKSSSAKIEIETSKAPVNVYVSSEFSGDFNIKSKNGTVAVVICNNAFGTLSFDNHKDFFKSGCFKRGKKAKNTIYIRTCNAPATLYIQ